MQVAQAGSFKNLNCKQDLISLIYERAKLSGKNMDNYTYKKLNEFSKHELFMMFAKIDYQFIKNKGEEKWV